MELTIGWALLAGVISFASPCFLPIVPAFVGQLVSEPATAANYRRHAAGRAGLFIGGFSLVFIVMWASLGLFGQSLTSLGLATPLRVIGGILLILMGLHVAGLVEISVFNRAFRMQAPNGANRGAGRAFLMGIIFAAGWTPCIGPVLGGILALATMSGTVARGIILMVAYCLGLGIPFLIVAMGFAGANERFKWFLKHEAFISILSGGFLILIGFLMITNLFTKLSAWIPGY